MQPVEPIDQQGPEFFYEIVWRQLDEDEQEDGEDIDDDEGHEWEKKIITRWDEVKCDDLL